MDRKALLDLLRESHRFPGPYAFRVVVRPAARAEALSAIASAAGPDRVGEVTERRSRHGTWVSLRVEVELDRAEGVLEVYEVLRELDAVRVML